MTKAKPKKPASEIIERLRRKVAKLGDNKRTKLLSEALAEIERLQAAVQVLSKEV
jgi:glycerol-3-phosphate dehydrogenase